MRSDEGEKLSLDGRASHFTVLPVLPVNAGENRYDRSNDNHQFHGPLSAQIGLRRQFHAT